eukprot:scaffold2656_cov365-Pavlova_lutheri.AAC.4
MPLLEELRLEVIEKRGAEWSLDFGERRNIRARGSLFSEYYANCKHGAVLITGTRANIFSFAMYSRGVLGKADHVPPRALHVRPLNRSEVRDSAGRRKGHAIASGMRARVKDASQAF